MSQLPPDITPPGYAIPATRDLDKLYREHQPWLLNWLRAKLSCPFDAGDMSQDTFLRLLSVDLASLREPRAYLLVIANRLMINRYRRKKVEADVLQQVAYLLDTSNDKGPAEIIAARDLLHRVLLMLTEELPKKPRQAFLMARVGGMAYRQIAKRLDVSESSVKQYIAKALMHCHKSLYNEFAEAD
ncbi:RNA polymerase sigma factor, sigma-70 family [Spongiibacter sp. IMCC21906]|uniref:sigma-70 family RNA polymerase sigma factor n=1 Tax=Spongiibacter sp. IMCC21906 TaxID=1620392 RepID=UPI00062DFFA0|nr:sigma-70 family RNA polymerase sigma factor [Spongiibacter sp. IMCC21906]AKH69451.1 RNA polymerase sigma factor, sigma-70 family [Spongiibacter sp. IMCC21906]